MNSVHPDSVMELLSVAIRACSEWFSFLMDISGFGVMFLSIITVYLVFRFLLAPLFGFSFQAGSDSSKRVSSYSVRSSSRYNKGTSSGSDMTTYSSYY